MKKLLFLGACLWALAGPARAQAGPPAVAVVRIFENGAEVKAVITRGEGQDELVSFKLGYRGKDLIQASEGYYKLLQKLYGEGYALQGTFSTANQYGTGSVTLFLAKAR